MRFIFTVVYKPLNLFQSLAKNYLKISLNQKTTTAKCIFFSTLNSYHYQSGVCDIF